MTTLVGLSLLDLIFCSTHAVCIVATLNPATMELLQLFRGDTIIVR